MGVVKAAPEVGGVLEAPLHHTLNGLHRGTHPDRGCVVHVRERRIIRRAQSEAGIGHRLGCVGIDGFDRFNIVGAVKKSDEALVGGLGKMDLLRWKKAGRLGQVVREHLANGMEGMIRPEVVQGKLR